MCTYITYFCLEDSDKENSSSQEVNGVQLKLSAENEPEGSAGNELEMSAGNELDTLVELGGTQDEVTYVDQDPEVSVQI